MLLDMVAYSSTNVHRVEPVKRERVSRRTSGSRVWCARSRSGRSCTLNEILAELRDKLDGKERMALASI
jgi:predicted 2-oxoglutarate/Fe(II)-dependent dioxygenase YbiX